MRRILLDTNALIDLCVARIPSVHEAMFAIIDTCSEGDDELLVSPISLADASYIIEGGRQFKEALPERSQRQRLAAYVRDTAFSYCTICTIDEQVAMAAHQNSDEEDFDDALIAECAAAYKADVIISSDRKAFRSSKVPSWTPEEYALGLREGQADD